MHCVFTVQENWRLEALRRFSLPCRKHCSVEINDFGRGPEFTSVASVEAFFSKGKENGHPCGSVAGVLQDVLFPGTLHLS